MKYHLSDDASEGTERNRIILAPNYEDCKLAEVYIDKKTGDTQFPYDGQLGVLTRPDGSAVLNQSKLHYN